MSSRQFYKKGIWLGVILGIGYGILLRLLFEVSQYFPGAMSMSFVMGTPVVIGAISVYYAGEGERISWLRQIFIPWLAVLAFMLTCLATLLEGAICVVLLSPVFALLASIGGLIGGYIYNASLARRDDSIKAIALLPILLALGETYVPGRELAQTVERTQVIDAPAAEVWRHIKNIPDIKPEEFATSFIYMIGVPYPQLGQVDERGQVRLSKWDKGISFEEKIVEQVDNQRMRWVYDFKPGDIPPAALDQHVEIGGKYFDVLDTLYETKTLASGKTELRLSIRYRISTNINWYANLWARFLVDDFERQILRVYQRRSEQLGISR